MSLAAAFTAGHLAARATERRFRSTEVEIAAAHERVVARRTAAAPLLAPTLAPTPTPTPTRRVYTERGRHAAPRPVRA
ncbi:hypothetical protein [Agromyces sp. CCNWLW203]|uniref:hypothetical protein n=1 Tax=Agromyces sp. CCNWLW203 TaxID=3112842 RepID=UPI002F962783